MPKPTIGFIGLGDMGEPMAAKLLEGGFTVLSCVHRRREAIERLKQKGLVKKADPREVATESDILMSVVVDQGQTEDALRGAKGADRHSENCGFLAVTERDRRVTFSMAPAYDNGTSLGYLLPETELVRRTDPDAIKKYISNGKHHFGWISGDHASAQHIELCRVYASRVRGTAETMKRVANINNAQIDDILSWCRSFDYSVPFIANRALFVAAQLRARRDALLGALLEESGNGPMGGSTTYSFGADPLVEGARAVREPDPLAQAQPAPTIKACRSSSPAKHCATGRLFRAS